MSIFNIAQIIDPDNERNCFKPLNNIHSQNSQRAKSQNIYDKTKVNNQPNSNNKQNYNNNNKIVKKDYSLNSFENQNDNNNRNQQITNEDLNSASNFAQFYHCFSTMNSQCSNTSPKFENEQCQKDLQDNSPQHSQHLIKNNNNNMRQEGFMRSHQGLNSYRSNNFKNYMTFTSNFDNKTHPNKSAINIGNFSNKNYYFPQERNSIQDRNKYPLYHEKYNMNNRLSPMSQQYSTPFSNNEMKNEYNKNQVHSQQRKPNQFEQPQNLFDDEVQSNKQTPQKKNTPNFRNSFHIDQNDMKKIMEQALQDKFNKLKDDLIIIIGDLNLKQSHEAKSQSNISLKQDSLIKSNNQKDTNKEISNIKNYDRENSHTLSKQNRDENSLIIIKSGNYFNTQEISDYKDFDRERVQAPLPQLNRAENTQINRMSNYKDDTYQEMFDIKDYDRERTHTPSPQQKRVEDTQIIKRSDYKDDNYQEISDTKVYDGERIQTPSPQQNRVEDTKIIKISDKKDENQDISDIKNYEREITHTPSPQQKRVEDTQIIKRSDYKDDNYQEISDTNVYDRERIQTLSPQQNRVIDTKIIKISDQKDDNQDISDIKIYEREITHNPLPQQNSTNQEIPDIKNCEIEITHTPSPQQNRTKNTQIIKISDYQDDTNQEIPDIKNCEIEITHTPSPQQNIAKDSMYIQNKTENSEMIIKSDNYNDEHLEISEVKNNRRGRTKSPLLKQKRVENSQFIIKSGDRVDNHQEISDMKNYKEEILNTPEPKQIIEENSQMRTRSFYNKKPVNITENKQFKKCEIRVSVTPLRK